MTDPNTSAHRFVETQHRLQRDLGRCVNGAPRIAGIGKVVELYKSFLSLAPPCCGPVESISIPAYSGGDPHVQAMIEGLKPVAGALVGAWVHGSLATNDTVGFSDFDTLVILRTTTIVDPAALREVSATLSALRLHMFRFDPLQHHGWLVMTEADLRAYCDAQLPLEVMRFSRSLCGEIQLNAQRRDSAIDFSRALRGLLSGIRRDIRPENRPKNVYTLKNTLSRAMLVPALYLQARYGRTVYKKYSFELARRDFPEDTWTVMDQISELREHWHYQLNALQSRVLTTTSPLRKFLAPRIAPDVPPDISSRISPELWHRLDRLVDAVEARIPPAAPS